MVNRISSERKVRKNVGTSKFEYSEGPLGDVLRTSWGRPESTSQGRPLNVGLGRPLNVISGHPRDVRSGPPQNGQIGSLGDWLGNHSEIIHKSFGKNFKFRSSLYIPSNLICTFPTFYQDIITSSQLANIGPQDLLKTSLSNVPRMSPKDPI